MNKGREHRPPRLASALLARSVPPGPRGEAILGDLLEGFTELVKGTDGVEGSERETASGAHGRAGLRNARLWYWKQALALGGRFLLRRVLHFQLYRRLAQSSPQKGRSLAGLSGLSSDVKFGLRSLLRDRGFTAIAMLTLALGIGATTAIFSAVNAVLLRPLPYHESHRLVSIRDVKAPQYLSGIQVAMGHFVEWRDRARSFDDMAAYVSRRYTLTGRGEPQRLSATNVSAGLFTMMGIQPTLGRDFTPAEDHPGGEDVVLVSHGLWQRIFGGDSGVLGQTLMLDGRPYTIVGVLPPDVDFPESHVDLWTPLALTPQQRQAQGNHHLWVMARLKPGVTMAQARTEMSGVAQQLEAEFPGANTGWGVRIDGLLESRVGDRKTGLWMLFAAVGFVLLIACANVANMLLVRASDRGREFAVRAAIGARPIQLLRRAFTESALLGMGGGLQGLLVAGVGVKALPALFPDLPRIQEVGLDGTTLAIALSSGILATLLFGTVPAAQALRSDPTAGLKEATRGSSSGPRKLRFRHLLVVSEVALALVLLTGSGLMVRSLRKLQEVDPGFRSENAWVTQLELPEASYTPGLQSADFFRQVTQGVAQVPGVEAVGVTFTLPFVRDQHLGFVIEGRPMPESDEIPTVLYYPVSHGYFQAVGLPLIRGRTFTEADREDAPGVVIINQTMAQRFFPDQDPIGQRIHVTNGPRNFREIIGVVGDVRQNGLDDGASQQVYEPFSQQVYPNLDMWLVVRSEADPIALSAAVRERAQELEGNLPVADLTSLSEKVQGWVQIRRAPGDLLTVFAAVALFLAALGIYGIMAYSVTRRTREVGIRMALGADRSDVVKLVFREGMTLTTTGVGIGLLVAFPLTRLMGGMLFGVTPADPATLVLAPLILGTASAMAILIPLKRATQVDPNVALRSE